MPSTDDDALASWGGGPDLSAWEALMWRTADALVAQTEATMTPEHRDLYADHIVGMKKFVPRFRRFAVPADDVAAVVEKALTARRPRARYVVGFGPRLQPVALARLPSRRATDCSDSWAVSRNEFVGPIGTCNASSFTGRVL